MRSEQQRDLARALCAAFIATRLRISTSYALKRYVGINPGPYWWREAQRLELRAKVDAVPTQMVGML